MTTTMIPHQTITTIVENVHIACAEMEKGFALLKQAQERLTAVIGTRGENYTSQVSLWEGNAYGNDFGRLATKAQAKQRRDAWAYLIRQTSITAYMTAARQRDFEAQITSGTLPELSVETVIATLQALCHDMNGLAAEFITEVFQWLRPQHSQHKTNKKYKVPYKVILTYAIAEYGKHLHHSRMPNMRALGNALSLLDGEGVEHYPRDFTTHLDTVIRQTDYGDLFHHPYGTGRFYQNGNLHLHFTRTDLIDKMNTIASDGSLPGTE